MSHYKYLLYTFFGVIITSLFFVGKQNRKVAYFLGSSEPLLCDTSSISSATLFDFSILLKSNWTKKSNANQFFFIIENELSQNEMMTYNRLGDKISFFNIDSTRINKLADTIAFKAIFSNNTNLFIRWKPIIDPKRNEFLERRAMVKIKMEQENTNFKFKIIDDIRKIDRQNQLYTKGKTASALSLHQFGLASDFGVFKSGKYLKSGKIYQKIGEEAIVNNLTWGGNFKGLAGDFGHVQLYKNSAEMLSKLPELKYEYEQFREFYGNRISHYEKEGKAELVEDSKQLIQIMDLLDEGKICGCKVKLDFAEIDSLQNIFLFKLPNYRKNRDFMAYSNLQQKLLFIVDSTNTAIKLKLGTWR